MVLIQDSAKLVFAAENKVLIKIANDSQWKLVVKMEYTRIGMLEWNQLAELGFADITGNARAIMVQANTGRTVN